MNLPSLIIHHCGLRRAIVSLRSICNHPNLLNKEIYPENGDDEEEGEDEIGVDGCDGGEGDCEPAAPIPNVSARLRGSTRYNTRSRSPWNALERERGGGDGATCVMGSQMHAREGWDGTVGIRRKARVTGFVARHDMRFNRKLKDEDVENSGKLQILNQVSLTYVTVYCFTRALRSPTKGEYPEYTISYICWQCID